MIEWFLGLAPWQQILIGAVTAAVLVVGVLMLWSIGSSFIKQDSINR